MPTDAEFAEGLEIFIGQSSPSMCQVYARWHGEGEQLVGTITGPTCMHAQTLKADYRLTDGGLGASLLAVARISEPCFWTPDLPHQYRAVVQLREGGKDLATAERWFGVRPLGVRNGSLYLDGQRYVIRGVLADELATGQLEDWRQSAAAMVVVNPTDNLCSAASLAGVLIVAMLDAYDVRELRRLSRFPAVGVVVLPRSAIVPERIAHNIVLGESFAPGEPVELSSWADIAICQIEGNGILASQSIEGRFPVMALRPAGSQPDIVTARKQCDALQRDLAGSGNYCGYLI